MTDRINASAIRRLAGLFSDKTDPALLNLGAGKVAEFLRHVGSSEPREDASPILRRWQDGVIADTIPQGASVLDLGCGEGVLLKKLIAEKGVRCQGVELDPEEVAKCVANDVPVFQSNLDEGLKGFHDDSFDYVILEETLQTLHKPLDILREMLRVGRRGIVSFPNFGYWRVRLDLAVRGRMPVSESLPFRWYDTPNIHLFTIRDLLGTLADNGIVTDSGIALCEGGIRELRDEDTLYAEEALLVLRMR